MHERALHYLRSNQLHKALALYRKICQKNKADSESWFYLGNIHGRLGKAQDAESCLRKAIRLDPRHAAAHYCLGAALREQGRLEEAAASYSQSLRLAPGNAEGHNNLGVILHELGRLQDAETSYRQAVGLNPTYAAAYRNLGLLLRDRGKYADAIEALETAIRLAPGGSEAYLGLGSLYEDLEQYDTAEAIYRKALRHQPGDTGILCNLAWLEESRCRYQKAMALLQEALDLEPELPEANFRLALHCLRQGDLHNGWPGYEWRLKTEPQRQGASASPTLEQKLRAVGCPLWDGSAPQGRTILVHGEQGIGDEIMFASCLPDLVKLGARLVLAGDPRLAPLFQRSFPDITLLEQDPEGDMLSTLAAMATPDYQIPIGSLPRHFRPTLDSFVTHRGYLLADQAARQTWRSRFDKLSEGLKVGISWKAGALPKETSRRSIPLTQWGPILKMPGIHIIDIQYGDHLREIEEAESEHDARIHRWPDSDPLTNLDDFAALVAELDLVIAVDNSTVHLAGALDVPVWALLPTPPNWRWMLDRDTSPWYPSARLFRRSMGQSWPQLIAEIAGQLEISRPHFLQVRRRTLA